jgi:hypothetical protein
MKVYKSLEKKFGVLKMDERVKVEKIDDILKSCS